MKKSLILTTLIALTLIGCQKPSTENPTPLTENPKSIQIITSFYPLKFLTQEITGNTQQVINLAGSTDVHDYIPSPQDIVKLNQADLIILQGNYLEAWSEDLIPQLQKKNIPILEVTKHIELRKDKDHNQDEEYESDHHEEENHEEHHQHENHENHEEHQEEKQHDQDHHNHHHGEFDPHTWLDPILAQDMIDLITKELIKINPDQKSLYLTNAKNLKDKFQTLHKKFQTQLQQCKNQEVIISHNALGYLEDRYKFKTHPITGFSTQDQPSAKILSQLKEEAAKGITHILIEENNIQKFAQTLAQETGLQTLTINPLGRGTLDPQKDFLDIMEENLKNLKTALQCP